MNRTRCTRLLELLFALSLHTPLLSRLLVWRRLFGVTLYSLVHEQTRLLAWRHGKRRLWFDGAHWYLLDQQAYRALFPAA